MKSFLSPSGLDEFPATDPATLRAGARACAKNGLILAVHAEDPELLDAAYDPAAPPTWESFVRSRPEAAEVAAIERCIRAAAETGCAMHIVHVSAPEGLQRISEARQRGVQITAETCPHYLLLDPSCMETLGARAKCAPPLRPATTRQALWSALRQGEILSLGSDHSPCLPAMKKGGDFLSAWGGISGAQHGMLLFLQAAREKRLGWKRLVALTSQNIADRFRLPTKRGLHAGSDADFVLLQPSPEQPVQASALLTRHALSPYVGCMLRWSVTATCVRGRPVYLAGQPAKPGFAKEVQPGRLSELPLP